MQPDNTEHITSRPHIEHQLVIAVLTAGPVGFGDSLPREGFLGTNVTRLLLASRADSVILKPAHTALRLDISPFRGGCGHGGSCGELWAAPAVPARANGDPAVDGRANSLARTQRRDGTADDVGLRWWYSILATDVKGANQTSACEPLSANGVNDRLFTRSCDTPSESAALFVPSDGTLRVPIPGEATYFCGSVSTNKDSRPTLTLNPGNSPSCSKFYMTADGTMSVAGTTTCVVEDPSGQGVTVVPCDQAMNTTWWTTRSTPIGIYDEPQSGHTLLFQHGKHGSTLYLTFQGTAWSTANCTLQNNSTSCDNGHFDGGPIGHEFPDCWWNASVALPEVRVSTTSLGCGKCCMGTKWIKRGYAEGSVSLLSGSTGKCLVGCSAASHSGGPSAPVYPRQLFPVPPSNATFVVANFGAKCTDGASAATCVIPFANDSPLNTITDPCPNGHSGCRNWRLFSVAPVLSGGWVLVGELGKYVAMSPQRFAVDVDVPVDPLGSDALNPQELGATDGTGFAFNVMGMPTENVQVTVVAPSQLDSLTGTPRAALDAAMQGYVRLVNVTIPESGRVRVQCDHSGCS